MKGRIIDGPMGARLLASLERALACPDDQDQGELLVAHQREVLAAITAGTRTQPTPRRGFELGDPWPSDEDEATPLALVWARARAEGGL